MKKIIKRAVSLFVCSLVLLSACLPVLAADVDYETAVSSEDKKGIVNILLIGTDALIEGTKDQGRGDCAIICSLNKTTGEIKLISIERAIYVEIPGVGKEMFTNAHYYGGAELMSDLVEQYFGLKLDGYCEINYQGFINAIDALCGIDIVLTEPEETGLNGLWNELCPENTALTENEMVEGLNHLSGYDALMYCRLRCIDSDWHRVERQRNLIQAVIDTAKSQTLEHNIQAARAVLEYVDTNLSSLQICSLLACMDKFTGAVCDQMTVPVKSNPIVCDYPAESLRIHEFIYGENNTEQ